jgi:hypothetical protein
MSSRVLALGLAAVVVGGTSAAFAQSSTIRIEPRPVYGATVSLEEGVRVYRPLPPERIVIVNPNGTPVNIGISEKRVISTSRSTSHSVSRNYWRGYGYRRCIPAVGDSC